MSPSTSFIHRAPDGQWLRRSHGRLFSAVVVACLAMRGAMPMESRVLAQDSRAEIAKLDAQWSDWGIRRSGTNLMLERESELKKLLDAERTLKNELKKRFPRYLAMEQEEQLRSGSVPQAFERIGMIDRMLANDLPVKQHNQLVAERNALTNQINQVRSDKAWPEQLKKSRAEFSSVRERYVENILAARKLADELLELWAELEKDSAVQSHADKLSQVLNQTVPLTPSRAFKKMIADLEKLEESVLSDQIPLRSDGGNTFAISVTVNGEKTVDMILDSGAGLISLPTATAQQLGVSASENSPDIQLQLADGRVVTAKLIFLPLVRVGRFEAQNVEAAILPPEMVNAEPLLGMSFLKNFQFKVDSNAKTLTMSEVQLDNGSPSKPPAARGKKN
jgi:aspartyl protease family protein